jgi:hypothetical protein
LIYYTIDGSVNKKIIQGGFAEDVLVEVVGFPGII